jgi:hypothetical protein
MYGEVKLAHDVRESECDSPNVNVCCALMKTKLLVLSSFEESMVTSDTFLAMLETLLFIKSQWEQFSS